MAKFDVQSAYSIVPVHTEVRQLLRMKWRGAFYVHMVLPFGVRSAGHISLDLVELVAKRNNDVTFLMHYLDDFHTLGSPGSSVCQHNLDRSIDCFSKLGIPLHPPRHSFSFIASPVREKSNPIADSLSHSQFRRFRRLAPHADPIPTQIQQQLPSDLELRSQINATST